MRRAGVALVLVALTACGQETALPPKSTWTPKLQTITPKKARAVAKAALLKPADVPRYRPGGEGDASDHSADASGCLADETVYLVERSNGFASGRTFVGTDVDIAPTVDHVTADMEALKGEEFLDCYKSIVRAAIGTDGIEVENYSSRRFAIRVPGADESVAVSVRLTGKLAEARIRAHLLVVIASTGHARIDVNAITLGGDAPSVSFLTSLLVKCVKRARAAQR